MKGYLKNRPQASRMRFEVTRQNGYWNIYFCSDTERKYIGCAETQADADEAVKKLMKTWGVSEKSKREGLSKETHRQLNRLTKRRMQVTAMSMDPVRAVGFYENLLMMNYARHILTDAFDEVDFFFSACIDQSTRDHFKIASKHITALLDAVLASQIQGDSDDYQKVYENAMYVKERIMPLVGYVMAHAEEHKWRLDELDRVLDNIMPDAWLTEERKKVSDGIIGALKGREEEQ